MPISTSRYGRKRMRPTRAKRTSKRRTAKSTPTFKKKVMAVVRRVAEKKVKVVNIEQGGSITSGGLIMDSTGGIVNGYVNSLLLGTLALAQGVEQEQRIGNQVSNAKFTISGVVTAQPYDGTTNPNENAFECHIVVFKNKKDTLYNTANNLKTYPLNVTGPADGSLINTVYPYNRDLYSIKSVRKFNMIGFIKPANPGAGPVASSTNQGWGKTMHRFSIDCGVNPKLKYIDGSNIPSNDWVGVGFYVVNTDGTVETNAVTRAVCVFDGKLTFTDM